jgi:hypothetical protein
MFRPYSLRSIAAWTVGSLTGNQAYYKAKAASRGLRMSKASCPPSVRKVVRKLEIICKEANALGAELPSMAGDTNRINLTPMLHVLAYYDWLESRREAIKDEIRAAYTWTMAEGYVWPPNIIEDLQKEVDKMRDWMRPTVEGLRQWLTQTLAQCTNPGLRQKFMDSVGEYQATFHVDESSYKLVKLTDQRFFLTLASPAGPPSGGQWR